MTNNIHDKVFDCPKCHNRTLVPIEQDKILGLGYGDILICEECAAELKANPAYDGTVKFEEIEEEEW
jgi:transcription elongation factor Elf1